jgi:hypothetical protein
MRKGIPPAETEAHAEPAREFIMAELVTKQDLALRMTVRLGTMLVIQGVVLAGLLKLA